MTNNLYTFDHLQNGLELDFKNLKDKIHAWFGITK